MVLTILMSLGLSVFRACMAASSAGMASARSLSHSSLMPLATAAASLATASSAATTYQYKVINYELRKTLLSTNSSWYFNLKLKCPGKALFSLSVLFCLIAFSFSFLFIFKKKAKGHQQFFTKRQLRRQLQRRHMNT